MSIELNNVRFSYSAEGSYPAEGSKEQSNVIVDIAHWQVASGEKVFVQGPSGSGKSTLLNLLSGMLKPSAGEISVLGQRLDAMTNRQRDKFRASHIGYVFQQFNLIPYLDAVENIQLAAHFSVGRHSSKSHSAGSHSEISQLLAALNIGEVHWRKPVAQLSIGQQQRIAIARAMINKPEIMIADEPTSSLDLHNRDNFMAELTALAAEYNTTLVFVSHDVTLARYFDRTDCLNDINAAGGHH